MHAQTARLTPRASELLGRLAAERPGETKTNILETALLALETTYFWQDAKAAYHRGMQNATTRALQDGSIARWDFAAVPASSPAKAGPTE
jgi:hypothetical protein